MLSYNADVLAIIASFLDDHELVQFALASKDLRAAAYPCLYAQVHAVTLPSLLSFADTVRNTPHLAPCVKHFTEGVSRWRPAYAGIGLSQRAAYASTILDLLQRLRSITHLTLSASLDYGGDAPAGGESNLTVARAISGLSCLTALSMTDVDFESLDILDLCAPLAVLHATPSHTQWTGSPRAPHDRDDWMAKLYRILARRHSATLVELKVPYSAGAIEKPEFARVRMPNVATLIVPEGVCATPQLAAMFPNLRNLRLGVGPHALAGVDSVWPRLEHLELEACAPDSHILSPGHRLRSLSFCVDRYDSQGCAKSIPALASPHVRGLRLQWEDAPPRMHDIVTHFPSLKYLEVPMRLDWLAKVEQHQSNDDIEEFWPLASSVEAFNFFITMLPPPEVGWDPELPLRHMLDHAHAAVKLIVITWLDADFNPHSRMMMRDSSGKFAQATRKEVSRTVAQYRYYQDWPRWPSSSFCTELCG